MRSKFKLLKYEWKRSECSRAVGRLLVFVFHLDTQCLYTLETKVTSVTRR